MREAIILNGTEPVNVIVLPDGADGDALLSATCVEITDLEPKPGLGNGWTFVDGVFVPPPVPPLTLNDIRKERDALLAGSDWTQMSDAPLTDVERAAWAVYRQALRDVPQQFVDPDDVVWPEVSL